MCENKDYLIELDSVVGDGDLGLTMSDGFLAAYNAVKDFEENDIGKLLYSSGKAMSTAVPSTMGTLMASGLTHAGNILKEAGTDLSHVVKTTVYMADMGDFAAMNEIYAQFFNEPYPARSAVAVKALPKGALVEVEVLAAK